MFFNKNRETRTLNIKSLSQPQLDDLKGLLSTDAQVILRNDPVFQPHARIFNGSIQTPAAILVRVVVTNDVCEVIKFARANDLTVSVKAGGYGTAGYAIQGDIIVDLCAMDDISIEPPLDNSSSELPYTPLRNIPQKGAKGKEKIVGFKRRQEHETAETVVSSTATRRRVEDEGSRTNTSSLSPPLMDKTISSDSDNSVSSYLSGGVFASNTSATRTTTPATEQDTPPDSTHLKSADDAGSDPFSYMDTPPVTIHETKAQASSSAGASSSSTPAVTSSSSTPVPPAWVLQRFPTSTSGNSNIQYTYPSSTTPLTGDFAFTELKPIYPHAYVTMSAGARQKQVDLYTHSNPLPATSADGVGGVIPYHVPFSAHPVGVSPMILGGFGFVSRLHGLSIDNVVELEVVLADGSVVIVNEHENKDLWWACRGAGPAFGIVTRIKAKAYPIPFVFAGSLIYTFRSATAGSFIKHIRDCVKHAPRELYVIILMTAGPPGKDPIIVTQICYTGNKEKGQEYLDMIKAWDGESCHLNDVNMKTFVNQQESVEKMLRGIWGRKWFIRSTLVHSLPDEVIAQTVTMFADSPKGCTWLFELAGGAVADFEDNCFPKSRREAMWQVAAFHQWDIETHDERCVAAAEEWIEDILKDVGAGGPFPCFLSRGEKPERTRGAFGENWERLVELKKRYDPDLFFKHNFWRCSGEEGVGPLEEAA